MNSTHYYNVGRTRIFSEIFPRVEDFVEAYQNCGIPTTITDDNVKTLYYLLLGKYGNSHIASSDENTFKLRLFTIVFSSGLVWSQKLQIQQRLAQLSDEELFTTVQTIYNRAQNPNEETTPDTILDYISSQDVNKQVNGKLGGLMQYYESFKNCTDTFISKFKSLFMVILAPESPLLYTTEEGGNTNE